MKTVSATNSKLCPLFSKVSEFQSAHSDINKEYEQLKKEVETLQVQIADLRFQISSKDMECDAAVKVRMNCAHLFVLLDVIHLSRVKVCKSLYEKSQTLESL